MLRRRLFQALTIGGLAADAGADEETPLTIEDLRSVAAFHGFGFSEERLRILLPVLENRRRQLRELRAIRIEDHAGPHLPNHI